MYIKWHPPVASKIMLNTDGATKPNPTNNGYEGIFRNSIGNCLMGFMDFSSTGTSTFIELHALLTGLQPA